MQQYLIWFDPQDTHDFSSEEDFQRLADAYGLIPVGRSCPPDDPRELWTASYRGEVHYMHVLNMWVLSGWKHLVYRDGKRLSPDETFAWVERRANARMVSGSVH